jgi:hypothetical protein
MGRPILIIKTMDGDYSNVNPRKSEEILSKLEEQNIPMVGNSGNTTMVCSLRLITVL